jgi:hypothetical protein
MLQIGAQLGHLAGAAGAVLAQLVQRGPPGLQLCLHGCQLLAQGLRLSGRALRQGPVPRRARRPVPARAGPAALSRMRCITLRLGRGPLLLDGLQARRSRSAWSRSMRWKAASAPRRRSSRPASSAVTCAASCCKPSRFCAEWQARPATHRGRLGRVLGLQARSPRASGRCRFSWPRARPCCARPAPSNPASRRSMRCASASICFSAAPWLAVSVSA